MSLDSSDGFMWQFSVVLDSLALGGPLPYALVWLHTGMGN